MGVIIKGRSGRAYVFEGPYSAWDELEDKPGLYAILCVEGEKLWYTPIDIGDANTVRSIVEARERSECWEQHCNLEIGYAVYYAEGQRSEIERDIRENYDLPCGG